jgi:FlaA1/EpsC-like NDP-sugar epimerase
MKLLSTRSIYSRSLLLILMIIDIVGIIITYKLLEILGISYFTYTTVVIGTLVWIVISVFFNFYEITQLIYFDKICYSTLSLLFIYFSLINFINLVKFGEFYKVAHLPLLILILGLVMIILKGCIALFIKFWRYSTVHHSSYIILGFNKKGFNIHRQIESLRLGHKLLGFFDNTVINKYVVGDISVAKEFCKKHHVNHLYYALPYDLEVIQDYMNFADMHFIYFSFICDVSVEELASKVSHASLVETLPITSLQA